MSGSNGLSTSGLTNALEREAGSLLKCKATTEKQKLAVLAQACNDLITFFDAPP